MARKPPTAACEQAKGLSSTFSSENKTPQNVSINSKASQGTELESQAFVVLAYNILKKPVYVKGPGELQPWLFELNILLRLQTLSEGKSN